MRKPFPLIPEGVKEKLVNTLNSISIQICGYKHLHPADNICPAHQYLKAKNKYVNKSNRSWDRWEQCNGSPGNHI